MIRVKNVHGTSKEKYANSYPNEYDSWIDYWKNKCNNSSSLSKCANKDCTNEYKDGAHVIKENSENDRKWYIVPLCKKCNHPSNDEYFDVNEKYLVPVSEKDINNDDDFDDLLDDILDYNISIDDL